MKSRSRVSQRVPSPMIPRRSARKLRCPSHAGAYQGRALTVWRDPGLAPDTAEVEMIMRSKFVAPLAWQAASSRPPPPTANELSEECVVHAVQSFAGPLALQAQLGPEDLQGVQLFMWSDAGWCGDSEDTKSTSGMRVRKSIEWTPMAAVMVCSPTKLHVVANCRRQGSPIILQHEARWLSN